ncbi:unnamed protein product [Leptosia nina]|uniref:NADH dehydrogenase [ubiquinone] 1 beta subcomplex subunit 3 n=1 Tax=Leptosia nina TaxID=320188 RepID=A0AAV1JG57_9NEOP
MGGDTYKVPEYTKFSSIKGIPQLEQLEKELAKKGLKDPWIRNEVWRYHPGFGTKLLRARKLFFRGFPLGLLLTVVTVAVEKAIGGDDHHDHAEH